MIGSAPIAAAVLGQEYQWLIGWYYALLLLDQDNDVVSISIEAPKVGPVDDIVIHPGSKSGRYLQVKYSVNASNPIDEEFWTGKTDGGQSFLQRLWTVFVELRKTQAQPELVLYTNRPMDSTHPILKLRDSKTGRLGAALHKGLAVTARKEWEKYLGITTDQLLDLLDHVVVSIDQRSERDLHDSIADRMAVYDLTRNVELGRAVVRDWVTTSVRYVDRDLMLREIEQRKLRAEMPAALLVVQAIGPHADAANAHASVDWVDLFNGETPNERRQLKDPSLWNTRVSNELKLACERIEGTGKKRVMVRGHARLATAFLIGNLLPRTRNLQLECLQNGAPWSTFTKYAPVEVPSDVESFSLGDDLAIGINVTRKQFSQDVGKYIRETGLPVRAFLHLHTPTLGPTSMPDDAHAMGFVMQVRDRIDEALQGHRAQKLHLFLAVPFPIALFLGHFWNRLPAVQLYEDQNPGYAPTFLVRA